MKISDLTGTMKETTITVSGYSMKKEENKDGVKAFLFSLKDGDETLFVRVTEKNKKKLYDFCKNVPNGVKITVTGELKALIKAGDSYNFLSPDEICVEEKDDSMQIIRLDAKNSFVEVMANAFEIDKLRMNFIQYDSTKAAGSRQSINIPIYIDLGEARVVMRRILNGYYGKKIAAEKANKQADANYYYNSVFESLGGTTVNALRARNQERKDGKAISRKLSIDVSTSSSYAFVLTASIGAGIENEKGLIVPSGKAEQQVRIPLTLEKAEELALTVNEYLLANTIKKIVR